MGQFRMCAPKLNDAPFAFWTIHWTCNTSDFEPSYLTNRPGRNKRAAKTPYNTPCLVARGRTRIICIATTSLVHSMPNALGAGQGGTLPQKMPLENLCNHCKWTGLCPTRIGWVGVALRCACMHGQLNSGAYFVWSTCVR